MNPKLTHAFILFLFINATYGNAQTILNGDFEINLLDTCAFNLGNMEFNDIMPNVYAYGNNDEMDVQTAGCGFAPTISNRWYVSLSQHPIGPIDQISLEIDQPLVEGKMYQLSYYEWGDTSSNPVFPNVNVPIEIGISTVTYSYGETVYTSTPTPEVWTQRTFEFVAPNNGKYITIRMAGDFGLKGWNFLDNFQLSPSTDTHVAVKEEVNIFPNPVHDWVNIETEATVKSIRLFNAVGQLMKSVPQANGQFTRVDMSGLAAGVYFLEIRYEGGSVIEQVKKI